MQQLDLTLRLSPPLEAALRLAAHLDGDSVGDILQSALDREIRRRDAKRSALSRNRLAARFGLLEPQTSSARA